MLAFLSSRSRRGAAKTMVCAVLVAAPALAAAADAFTISNTTLPAGTGEQVIDRFYPDLRGRGFGPQLEQQLNPQLGTVASNLAAEVNSRLAGLRFEPFLLHMA